MTSTKGCSKCRPWIPYIGTPGETPTTNPGHRHHPSGWVLCECQKRSAR